MPRSRMPFSLAAFKVAYWTAACLLPLPLLFLVPTRNLRLVFNALTILMYVTLAAAIYRLLLRFAFLAGGSDAVEREIHHAEGRVELNLRDRERPEG